MTAQDIYKIAEECGCGSYPHSNGIFQPPLNLQKFADRMHAAGKREAAQHILELWKAPWSWREPSSFIDRLKAYVEELK